MWLIVLRLKNIKILYDVVLKNCFMVFKDVFLILYGLMNRKEGVGFGILVRNLFMKFINLLL